MPWQQQVVDVALEVDEAGRFCYQLVLVTVPRQSGKTTLYTATMVHRALIVPRARVWYTMQSGKHATDLMLNEIWPLLAPFVPKVHLRRAAGSEHIKWLPSGGLVRPFPPTPDGLHGKVSDMVVVDEPWAFDLVRGNQIDTAIVPTQATRPNAQTWKVSTAGDASSTWWLGSVEQGRAAVQAGRTEGVAYFEWSCPADLDACEPASWPAYHPAYGRTIGEESMRAALDMFGPDEFRRSFGNQWVSTLSRVIPLEAWRAAADDDQPLPEPGRVALAFDVAVDRSDAAVVAAWRDELGIARVEVAAHEMGVGWLADRLEALRARWAPLVVAYDEAGPAVDVADVVRRAGLEVTGLKAGEVSAGCAGLLEALVADPPGLRYRPHPGLDAAANDAARRARGDQWVWGRRQTVGSLACLYAATCALWAYDHAPAPAGPFRIL